jgi:hypothetical protein
VKRVRVLCAVQTYRKRDEASRYLAEGPEGDATKALSQNVETTVSVCSCDGGF